MVLALVAIETIHARRNLFVQRERTPSREKMSTQPHWSNAMTPSINTADTGRGVSTCSQAAKSPPCEALNFDELRNRCMGNLNLVHRVLSKFQKRLPEELAEMNKALERGDMGRIAHIAHRVKGTSASVSAKGLALAAAEIEDLSRAGRATDIPARIEHFRDEWEKCLDEAVVLLSGGDIV